MSGLFVTQAIDESSKDEYQERWTLVTVVLVTKYQHLEAFLSHEIVIRHLRRWPGLPRMSTRKEDYWRRSCSINMCQHLEAFLSHKMFIRHLRRSLGYQRMSTRKENQWWWSFSITMYRHLESFLSHEEITCHLNRRPGHLRVSSRKEDHWWWSFLMTKNKISCRSCPMKWSFVTLVIARSSKVEYQ